MEHDKRIQNILGENRSRNQQNSSRYLDHLKSTVKLFYDENAIQFFDPDHSDDEDRFILLGISFKLRVVVVCHCFRENDTVVRIISARKADGDEENEYWRNRR